jgi:hypothetical protein
MSSGQYHVALVACTSMKRSRPSAAKCLYNSPWFNKARRWAEKYADRWYILSARHYLLHPGQVVWPYSRSLNAMPADDRRRWAIRVYDALRSVTHPDRAFVTILAGRHYREHLEERLVLDGYRVNVPMRGMRIGQQLVWLNERLEENGDAPLR